MKNRLLFISISFISILGLYLFKCQLGIDFSREYHLWDYFFLSRGSQNAIASGFLLTKKINSEVEQPEINTSFSVTINFMHSLGVVNKKIFFNNLLGQEGPKAANYGYGLWDGKWSRIQEEPLELAKKAGITMARFPGGCGSHNYDWKQAVGKNRARFWFGIY